MAEETEQPIRAFVASTGDIRPIPDPTELTRRSTEAAKDELRREISFVRELLTARMDANDKAVDLLETWRETLPGRLDDAMQAATNVVQERFLRVDERFNVVFEKFASIVIQFEERDTRGRGDAAATKTAVDAAFQAQKDMVAAQNANIAQALARIEATAQKQIEQLVTLLQTSAAASNDKIDDMKQRLSLIEGRTAGVTAAGTTQREQVVTQQGSSNLTLAMIAIGVSVVLGLGAILLSMFRAT